MEREPQFMDDFVAELRSLGPTAFRVKYRGAMLVGVGFVARVAERPLSWRRRTLGAVPVDEVLPAASIVDRVWRIRKSEGSTRGAAIALGQSADNDIILPEYTVSTQHAAFTFDAAGMSIMDLGSLNGTKVDGVLIEPLTAHRLKDGQQMTFGRLCCDYHVSESFAAAVESRLGR